jgi:hypothetical protein
MKTHVKMELGVLVAKAITIAHVKVEQLKQVFGSFDNLRKIH